MSVNFIFLIIGLLVSSVVPPLAFMLTWPAVPRGAAIASAIGGQVQRSPTPWEGVYMLLTAVTLHFTEERAECNSSKPLDRLELFLAA